MVTDDAISPAVGFDLTRLRKFYDDRNQDSDAAIRELATYLQEELASPSPPRMGVGGGPIDTVYVQDVIITVMAQTIPKESLLQALHEQSDDRIKDRMRVALVAAGDQTFVNWVEALLSEAKDNLTRLIAVRALRNAPRKGAEPALAAMRDNTYSRIVFRHGAYYKVYPIRRSAHEALTQLGVVAKDWQLEVPLHAQTGAEALSAVLDDENAEQSVAVLQVLESASRGDATRVARNFLEARAANPQLAAAVKEAERILGIAPGARRRSADAGQQDPERMLEDAKAAWARADYAAAEHLAQEVLNHPLATENHKRRAQLILDRVAESRSGAGTSQPATSATQPAAPPASQPTGTPPGS
jgi:hypothetical protein